MAIALDSSGTVALSGSPSTGTINNAGGNILFFFINGDIDDTVTSVTYNGVGMTLVQKANAAPGTSRWQYLYYMVGPATGSNTVQVNVSATNIGLANGKFGSFSGAKQTDQPDASGTNTTSGAHTSQSKTLTTVADNCWWIGVMHTNIATQQTDTGDGEFLTDAADSFSTYYSNGAKTPAGNVTMSCTFAASTYSEAIIASFSPAVATGVFKNSFFTKQAPNRASTY